MTRTLKSTSMALIGAMLSAAPIVAGDHWPQFRGPGARGVADQEGLPSSWSATENVVWKREVPGRGWSSPIVWGDALFLTTVSSDGPVENAKKGLYYGGNRSKPSPHNHQWLVYRLDARDGRVVWKRLVHAARPGAPLHVKNTYASETPVTDGERVYSYFGNVGVFVHNFDGELVWRKRFEPRPTRYGWGTAASPVLHGDRLYIVNDNEEESFLIALDRKTGDTVWRVERDEKSNWATPFVWQNPKRSEIITPGTGKVRSYDLSGELLWELRGMSSITIPTPFAAHGMLYFGAGFVLDESKPVYAVRPGASGDISLAPTGTSNEWIAWCDRDAAPYNPSFIVYGDHLYTLFDRGFLACREARTGEVVYRKRRIGEGASAFTSSPWAYDGKIFCLSEDGDTFVIRAGPEFEVLGVNSLDEMCMATPAIAGGRLYVRTLSKVFCIGASDKETGAGE